LFSSYFFYFSQKFFFLHKRWLMKKKGLPLFFDFQNG